MSTTENEQWSDEAASGTTEPGVSSAGKSGWQSATSTETVAVVAVVAVGTALIEAALIPGMILGVATMLVPKVLPRLGDSLQPVFRATVRGAYNAGRKARHAFAEAQEQVQDVVAEAQAENASKHH